MVFGAISSDSRLNLNNIDEISECCIELSIQSNIQLKKHQIALIHKCMNLENNSIPMDGGESLESLESVGKGGVFSKEMKTRIGIIGDKVGSGKSFSILGLFLTNLKPLIRIKGITNHGMGHIMFDCNEREYDEYLDMNVIVCSFGLINQWTEYVTGFSKEFKLGVVNNRASLLKFQKNYKTFNIVLVSASFYRYFQEFLTDQSIHVTRCVFDEVDSVSIPCAKEIPTYFNWFVSASYKNILYPYTKWAHSDIDHSPYLLYSGITNNSFVKSIFGSLLRNIANRDIVNIQKIVMKCKDSFVDESFLLPDPVKFLIICENLHVTLLDGITSDNIIRSLNAGDVNTAISFIDKQKVGTQEQITMIVKESLRISATNAMIMLESTRNMIFSSDKQKQNKIDNLQAEFDAVNLKSKLLEERITCSNVCSICFCEFDNKSITDCCKNAFCLKCICKWISQKPNCPLCKEHLTPEKLYVIGTAHDEISVSSTENRLYDKFISLVHLIEKIFQKENSKVVIFSEYEQTFSKIEDTFKKMNIKVGFLKGNNIHNVIRNFKYGDTNILLVNSSAYGSGINLENTTDIVLFHNFDTQIEEQVIGRAQRPGRTNQLNIHYLLYKNEIRI
jgi:SNF2 family DNA or RNA helicase